MYPSYHTLQSRYEWGDLLSQISWSRLAASLGCVMWCFFLASRLAICWRFVGRWGHGFNLKWQERPSHDSSIEVSGPITPKLSVRFYPWMDGDYVEKIDVGRPLSHTITAGDVDGWWRNCPVWSAPEPELWGFVVHTRRNISWVETARFWRETGATLLTLQFYFSIGWTFV